MPCFYCCHCGKCGGDSYGYEKPKPGRCARCGHNNAADAKVCEECGAEILPLPGQARSEFAK